MMFAYFQDFELKNTLLFCDCCVFIPFSIVLQGFGDAEKPPNYTCIDFSVADARSTFPSIEQTQLSQLSSSAFHRYSLEASLVPARLPPGFVWGDGLELWDHQ